jgi:hypothetical protein
MIVREAENRERRQDLRLAGAGDVGVPHPAMVGAGAELVMSQP